MVPYVRKSFYKHFLDGMKYCEAGLTADVNNTMSVVDEEYLNHPAAYQYAVEIKQN